MKHIVEPIGGEFGVSCVIPTLDEVIGLMEKKLQFNRGYTRFIMHPYVQEFIDKQIQDGEYGIVVSSLETARFFTQEYSPVGNCTLTGNEHYGLIKTTDQSDFDILFRDMRNTGFILNPHIAKSLVEEKKIEKNPELKKKLIQELSEIEKGANPDRTLLFVSGMAALAGVLFSKNIRENKGHTIMVGNPYIDSRELLQKIAARKLQNTVDFISVDDDIEKYIKKDTGFILIEFPTNPLIRCTDIEKIVHIAHKNKIKVMIDSTIATPFNISPLKLEVDIVMHSTTKFLNGMNDHIGGVLFFNNSVSSEIIAEIKTFQNTHKIDLCDQEAEILLNNLKEFNSRMKIINKNTLELAEWLNHHDKVEKVFYPLLESHSDYSIAKKYLPQGAGGLLSFVLKKSGLENAKKFYNHCTLPGKGPSLGSEQTLLCPITLLTFFHESDEMLKQLGQNRYTMRVSVGTENIDEIKNHLNQGLLKIS